MFFWFLIRMELLSSVAGEETKVVTNQRLHLHHNTLLVRLNHQCLHLHHNTLLVNHSRFPTVQAQEVFSSFPTDHVQVRKIKCILKFVCGYYLHIKEKPFLKKNHGMPS